MALSGVYSYTRTANQVIQAALEELLVVGQGETITGNDYTRAYDSINRLLKQIQTDGGHLWTETEGTLFPQKGQAEYDFSTAKLANKWFETKTTADASAGDTSIEVLSVDNIQAGDNIGIILHTGFVQWTTVASIATLTVNLDDPLESDTLSGGFVRNYRDSFIPVLRVMNVRRRESDQYEIPIVFESREDYFNLPNKEQQGTPIQAYYSRQEPFGKMYLWSTPNNADQLINFTYERKLNIVEDNADDIDIPDYWVNAFILNLASMLAPRYGVSPEIKQDIYLRAKETMSEALSYDNPVYPITINMQRYG